jgi:hypothetical protein
MYWIYLLIPVIIIIAVLLFNWYNKHLSSEIFKLCLKISTENYNKWEKEIDQKFKDHS